MDEREVVKAHLVTGYTGLPGDTGAVHRGMDLAELVAGRGECCTHGGGFGDVRAEGQRASACSHDLGRDSRRRITVAVHARDRSTQISQEERCGTTDSGSRSYDDGGLLFEGDHVNGSGRSVDRGSHLR